MNKTTFEEYKNAIRAQYEATKMDGVYGSGDISNITPAQLRDLCWRISEMGLTKADESTFRFFFSAKEDEKLGRAIDNFGTGKLKSVISFLKGGDSENTTRIELASIIIDFNPRPFNRYRQNGGLKNITAIEISPVKEQNGFVSSNLGLGELIKSKRIIKDSNIIKIGFPFFVTLLLSFFILNGIIFPAKECMQWKVNHYEAVDCTTDDKSEVVIPYDENTMKLRKLDSKAALVFFKNDKPVVWYSKQDGKIELFNQSGYNPETERPLRAITNYIIYRYELKQKK